MPQFFRFPAYRAPLLRNLVLSLVLAAAIALLGSVLASAVALAATLYLTYYGFVVIERSAQGFLSPNDYPESLEPAGPWRPLKMFAILVVAFFVVGVVSALADTLLLAALAVVALLLPASVMTLAVSDSLRQAINPARLLDMALKIGLPYLVLFVFLLILMGGSQQAFELVEPLLGESMGLLVFVS